MGILDPSLCTCLQASCTDLRDIVWVRKLYLQLEANALCTPAGQLRIGRECGRCRDATHVQLGHGELQLRIRTTRFSAAVPRRRSPGIVRGQLSHRTGQAKHRSLLVSRDESTVHGRHWFLRSGRAYCVKGFEGLSAMTILHEGPARSFLRSP